MRRVLAMMSVLALGAAVPLQNEAAADGGTVIHVSVSSGSDSGDGSATSPYKTISTALTKASDGDTIELAEGVYQEGELMVTKSVTITAASGAKPVISGAKSPDTWKDAGNGTWATANDMVRFCDVCTTNADPSVEGMAAHPEQVFVDGQPLTQVATRAEVTASTFFVDDPDPVTLKDPKNNRAGYNVKPHTGTSYVIGVNPAEHKVEVVQHSRALTVTTDKVSLKNLTVEKYAPVQAWDYKDPQIGTLSGGAMVLAGGQGLKIENSAFRYASAATALAITDAKEATISGNTIENNGAVGFGINRSSNVNVEKNRWTSNNTAGFNTTSCGAYCTIGDTKITHSEGIRYAYNTVDYSNAGTDVSKPDTYKNDQRAGVWFDEGVINSQVIGNYFVNVPVAIFNEVSSKNMIASNIIEGAGIGIHVSGSDNTQIWNNTISHALTSIAIREDSRSGRLYDTSAHFLWVGERTRGAEDAHVALLEGVHNPIGVKVGPTTTPDELLALVDHLNPNGDAGRLTLITRMGAGRIRAALPALIEAITADGRPVTWVTDPMHGNTITSDNGYKTRRFDTVMDELRGFFEVHRALGTVPGGIHVELTGDDVTEVLGGGEHIDEAALARRYETLVDPRLNHQQSLEMAFEVAEMLRR